MTTTMITATITIITITAPTTMATARPAEAGTLFDAYVIVDWSAAATPKQGADSVWLCCLERGAGAPRLANPPTRLAAMHRLADWLSDLAARDRRVLAGFDFGFGYPQGLAVRLRPDQPDWHGVWKALAARVRDGADNANNRFAVAADLNRALSGGPFPFWGCTEGQEGPDLSRRRPEGYGAGTLPERRLAEQRLPRTQPVWKLAYPGSVGSQTLLGIAHLHALRHHPWLAGQARVWPFETGLRAPDPDDGRILLAEVWPPLAAARPVEGQARDAAQVEALARHFATLDDRAALAPLFAGPADLTEEERRVVETEEGWILGAGEARPAARQDRPQARTFDYISDPAEIYRLSFERIRAETDFAGLPEELRGVAERLVHTCGDPAVVQALAASPGAAAAGRAALAGGAPLLCDVEMVRHGIIRDRLPAANEVVCLLNAAGIKDDAAERGTTRSAAAVDLWRPLLGGAVVVIGNAPTALFRLLELLAEGAEPPALIVGMPVGFVGAAESKQALVQHASGVPWITLHGRRGGSALAAACINALTGGAS